ncbi:uncharacterized protein LOC117913589 isoform X3 [Vitis riparia]|nr:uncharacterized protein LOC117913589 isoform X3 [Vitis riparia]
MGAKSLALMGIVPEELTEENYENWKACLRNYLIGQGLWDVVSGVDPKPGEKGETEAFETWRKKNAMALHAIQMSCGSHALVNIRETDSAKFAWDHLVELRHHRTQHSPPLVQHPKYDQETLEWQKYKPLFEAVDNGDWRTTKAFLDYDHNAVRALISPTKETALHVAILAGHVHIVKELVKLMTPKDLELISGLGETALTTAAISGITEMAETIVNKHAGAVSVGNEHGQIPVIVASFYDQKKMVRYLYGRTPIQELSPEKGTNGATLLNFLVSANIYDIALHLLKHHRQLGFIGDYYGKLTMRILAQKPSAFPSGSKLVFWERWIYSLIHIKPFDEQYQEHEQPHRAPADEDNPESSRQGQHLISRVPSWWHGLILRLLINFVPDFKHIYETKWVHVRSSQLLDCIFEEIPNLTMESRQMSGMDHALYDAIKHGIVEFVVKLMKQDHESIWRKGIKGRTMFSHAIVLRQEKIFSLIYGLGIKKNIVARRHDIFHNNILHLAGKLSPPSQLDRVSGAALQMQRELQWFKEVESMVQAKYKEEFNEYHKTPSTVFTEEHATLVKEGESWMKSTAASCMVVATLIAALMFTTAFTLPGGTKSDTGIPVFIGHGAFMVFIVADSLSLFSSSTSVLMFLGILTSRYAEEDFLKSLPNKLIIGLSSLFFSLLSMMVAFGSAIYVVLSHRIAWVSIPLIVLACIPITFFALLQFPLLVEIVMCTYGRSIFDKPTKLPF